MAQNCAGGTLAAYVPDSNKPWNSLRVAHLYKRLGFGASYDEIQAGLLLTPGQLVDNLINDAKAAPLPTPPAWYNWNVTDYADFNNESIDHYKEWYFKWMSDMLVTSVRENFALFWHNHFVTKFVDYRCPSYMYEYHKLLQTHAFGNFKDFLKAMGKTPAMLFFLDGRLNYKNRPNENYARELFELFTMGVNNGYTQQDITEAAKALTGYTSLSVQCGTVMFDSGQFNNTTKTIFGQQGNFDFDGVHDLIFQERATEVSQYICSKIYTHFVHALPNQTIIDGMAQTFRNNNFEIEPVLLELFKSDHFYEDDAMDVVIKSPVDFLITTIKEGNFPYDNLIIELAGYLTIDMGQQLFNPIDVSGWSGNRSWINSTTITKRWDTLSQYFGYVLTQLDKEKFRELAVDVSNNSSDVAVVARKITDHFIPKGLENAADYNQATIALKATVPQNYFDLGLWNLTFQYVPEQVYYLLLWIVRRPEFQMK
jgi:uncharacterized protein (DUF1800 family)